MGPCHAANQKPNESSGPMGRQAGKGTCQPQHTKEELVMSMQPPVLITVTQKVAHVVMNRPEAVNAMSRGMITQLRQALEQAQNDPNVSIIVLSGAGNNFCAGDDLKEAEQQSAEAFLALIMDLQRLTRLLLLSEKPTTAVMEGNAAV